MEVSPTQFKMLEAAFMSTLGGVGGAVCGGLIGMVTSPRNLAASLSRIQYARVYARECSAFGAAYFGIGSIMSGIRGKDDVTNQLVSGSVGGLALSFVRKGFKVNPADALPCAIAYAILTGTGYKVNETITSRYAQEALYTESRAMLSKLGLEEYEKNFKKAHLTDPTLPLLTDSDLIEVDIPLGPRLLILDHIKRYNKMVNRK